MSIEDHKEVLVKSPKNDIPHPGKIIAQKLAEMNLSVEEMAEKTGIPKERLEKIIKGKSDLTLVIAMKLAIFFENDTIEWVELQRQYNLEGTKPPTPFIEGLSDWVKDFRNPANLPVDNLEFSIWEMTLQERYLFKGDAENTILNRYLNEITKERGNFISQDYVLNRYMYALILRYCLYNRDQAKNPIDNIYGAQGAIGPLSDLFALLSKSPSGHVYISYETKENGYVFKREKEGFSINDLLSLIGREIKSLHAFIRNAQGVMFDRRYAVAAHYREVVDSLQGASVDNRYRLALLHLEGKPILHRDGAIEQADMETALVTLHELAEEGFARAQMILYHLYSSLGDYTKADDMLAKASSQGFSEAIALRDNRPLKDDSFDFYYFYALRPVLSEDQEMLDSDRCFDIAERYNRDNLNDAYLWYVKSAELGHAKAQLAVGRAHQEGWVRPTPNTSRMQHEILRYKCGNVLTDLYENFNPDNIHALHRIYKTPVSEPDKAAAALWYAKAAEQGNADAQYRLALLHISGDGVARDYIKAYDLLNIAAIQNHEAAKSERDILEAKMDMPGIIEAQSLSRAGGAK